MNKYTLYEEEKRLLEAKNLSPEEYEKQIRKIAKKLKI
jgi:hypothetical protein